LAREIYPSRYIQAGIAEQDMVSMAGTLALKGKIPFVHSFATFLTMRPTEQIFNNATEKTSVVYVGFLAGLLPSPPGFSHQAVTDVGIMASIPGMLLIEPACEFEMEKAYAEALNHKGPTYIRMVSLGSIPTAVGNDSLEPGDMTARAEGTEIAIVCSGPLLAEEAVKAAMLFGERVCAVFTYPFLNSPPSQRTLTSLRNWIMPVSTPRVATCKPLGGEAKCLKKSIFLKCLYPILTAGWGVATTARKQWRNSTLIQAYQQNRQSI
jgi:deoxyxylulose-5-phosphate synthase